MVSKMKFYRFFLKWIHDNFVENEQIITGEVPEYDYGTTITEANLTNWNSCAMHGYREKKGTTNSSPFTKRFCFQTMSMQMDQIGPFILYVKFNLKDHTQAYEEPKLHMP